MNDQSFDDYADVSNVMAEFRDGDVRESFLPVRKLKDSFDEAAGQLKVYLRVRPSSTKAESTVKIMSDSSIVTTAPETSKRATYTKTEERHYTFNRVFGPDSLQEDVFSVVAMPLVERFLLGDSCVLFAYGITNAGKTHTIQGSPEQPGLLPQIVNYLLTRLENNSAAELKLSILEIYQEKIYDLLNKKKEKLTIRDGNGRVEVNNLSSHKVSSSQEALKLLTKATTKRSKGHTLLNADSSRSHAIYSISLYSNGDEKEPTVFQIIDLAGAERMKRTWATAHHQKEANQINMSLMQLWRCLEAMKKKSESTEVLPFRESKLTHLLVPSLSRAGISGVGMIACINPQHSDYDETITVLGNASLAVKIKEIVPTGRVASVRMSTISEKPIESKRGSVAGGNENASRKRNADSMLANNNKSTRRLGSVETSEEVKPSEDIKKLMERIEQLEKENSILVHNQMLRETEIRREVSNEMAKRSEHLLSQIQELQDELFEMKHDHHDLTKSCKKAKRVQKEREREGMFRDLQQAEEEMEEVKSKYEAKISVLNNEIIGLKSEVAEWKTKHAELSRRATNASSTVTNENSSTAAETFDSRMQRDQRFKRIDSHSTGSKSPPREPLSPVNSNNNSPNHSDASADSIRVFAKMEKPASKKKFPFDPTAAGAPIAPPRNTSPSPIAGGTYMRALRSNRLIN